MGWFKARWFPWAAFAVVGLVLLGIALIAQARAGGERITAARLTSAPTTGYQLPPEAQPSGLSQGQPIDLPFAPKAFSAPGPGTSIERMPTQASWYWLEAPSLKNEGSQLYLYIPRRKSDGTLAIYANGRLIHQAHANLQWNGSNQPLLITLPHTAASQPLTSVAIRLQHVRVIGGALSSVWVGDYWQLAPRYTIRHFFQVQLPSFSAVAFLVTGVFGLFLWFGRRNERIYLLYFAMSAACFARMLHIFMGARPMILSDDWFGWLTVASPYWMILTTHLFLEELHERREPILTWTIVFISFGWTIATLPGLLDPTLISVPIYTNLLAVGLVGAINAIVQSSRAGSRVSAMMGVWCLVTIAAGVYDLCLQQNLVNIENVYLTNFAGVGFTLLCWYIMYSRYSDALEAATKARTDLASRLAQREAELTASHAQLREIEHRELIHQERQRLMQDMHDGLGSTLVSALRAFENDRDANIDAVAILHGCIDDLKLTIDSMEPVETDLLLLLATLRFRLQPRLQAGGVKLTWRADEVPPLEWLDQRHALHILRILQEAFANILKHAGASEISLMVRAEDDRILIRVRDDGRGFDPTLPSNGRGLANQRSRADAIGGVLFWEPSRRGSTLVLSLPVKKSRLLA